MQHILNLKHVISQDWEQQTRGLYKSAYSDMLLLFSTRIERGFERAGFVHDTEMSGYLSRLVIDNIRFVGRQREIIDLLLRRDTAEKCYYLSDEVRCWETPGEIILIYSSIFKNKDYFNAGVESFSAAAMILHDFSRKATLSDELAARKELDEAAGANFSTLVHILKQSELTADDIGRYRIN